ncbi:MAG: HAD-IIA family hydrolase [Actinomycetota bacterium]
MANPSEPFRIASLVQRYEAFAIDLDGVVWVGEQFVEGAAEAIASLREAGKTLLFVSNNAAYLPSRVVTRFREAGIEAEEREILTSAHAAREWIRREGLVGEKAFVLASSPVPEQLADLLEIVPVEVGSRPSVVFVARDTGFNYRRLSAAAEAIRHGAVFAAANKDSVLPVPGGFEAGTGALVAAIEMASGAKATVLGKPHPPMMQAAVRVLGRQGVLMIGDRADSDVAGARSVGWDAALVLSGVTRPGDRVDPPPDYVMSSLGALARQGR